MAVDTILNTATRLQTTSPAPAPIKESGGVPITTKDNRLSQVVESIQTSEKTGNIICNMGSKIIKSVSSVAGDMKSDEKNNTMKGENKNSKSNQEDSNVKSEKIKDPGAKNNGMKGSKVNIRSPKVIKTKDVKNTKLVKETEANSNDNKVKDSCGERVINKNTKIPPGKRNVQEEDGSSDESSTEYVTFDTYIDTVSNGKTPERNHCFNRLDNDPLSLSSKPSSPSSSISSVSTININETPTSRDSVQQSIFDAKTFRTSLLEASELPPHEIFLQSLSKEKEIESGHVCAWSPSISISTHIELKPNVPKSTSKRQHHNTPNSPKIQRSSTQKEEGTNSNSFTVPAVYDRLATLGRYREFYFEHRPDDWQWYMKEYNATHTVGKVGVKKKKKQLKFGVNVPDPYASMGKRIVSNSNLDSRQNTFYQADPATSSVVSKERKLKKNKNGEDVPTSCLDKDEEGDGMKKDRNYPVLAPTRDANLTNTNGGKGSKSDKTVTKSTSYNVKDKQQKVSNNNNNNNNNSNRNHQPHRHQPQTTHPHLHPPHPGVPQLSGEDVKLTLISSKISHQRDKNENGDENGDECEEEEEDKLWKNPFESPNKSRDNVTSGNGIDDTNTRKSRDASHDKSQTKKSITDNVEIRTGSSEESHQNASVQPFGSECKQIKTKSTKNSSVNKSGSSDSKTPSKHLKAELERENDGSLMVKISVFNKEKTKVEKFLDNSPAGKRRKTVTICREESLLMGKELHEKLKSLNHSELAKNEIIIPSDRKDEPNVKENKSVNKIKEVQQMKIDFEAKDKTNVSKSFDNEDALELQGRVYKRKKTKSKAVKNNADVFLGLDNVDLYPRHRTAYQEIEYITNNTKPKARPKIKYTKSKSEEKRSDQNVTQNKDNDTIVQQNTKQGKVQLRQTMLIRSSTVHLTPEVDSENVDDVDTVLGKNVHQVYPLDDWKKTADQGKCGFIVKSFPSEMNDLDKKATTIAEPKTNNTDHVKTSHYREKDNPNVFLTTKYTGDDNEVCDDGSSKTFELPINSMTVSLNVLKRSSLSIADEGGKPLKSLNKSRPLYRSKPELPSIKVSTNSQNTDDKDNNTLATNIKTYHFPPIHPPDNNQDKQTALDDLFVSGVSHDRSRPRDNSFIYRKRPVSLDRGLIDDLVRYHTEATSIGFKNQQNQFQTQLQIMHPHHPSYNHHHSFLANSQQPFKTQPEESPSLTPSVQKINKVQSSLRSRPKSPRDERKVTSSLTDNKERDHKRQMQIYAHVRKSHDATNFNDDNSNEKTSMTRKQENQLPDLQHILGFNKLS